MKKGLKYGFHSKFPCKGCNERTLGCHGKCEKYAETKNSVNETREKVLKERNIEEYEILSIRRCKH